MAEEPSGPVPVPTKPDGPDGTPENRRELIRLAAVELFARHGYRGTTVRAIAERAGVDPALVMYHYGSKEKVFSVVIREAMRAEELLPALPELLDDPQGTDGTHGSRGGPGSRLVRGFLTRWEDSGSRSSLLVVFRSAMEHPEASRLFREVAGGELLVPIARRIPTPDPEVRAVLVASLLVGLVTGRYVVPIGPLADMDLDTVVDLYGPYADAMLLGRLGAPPPVP
ncbi:MULTISPECIES: TetR/AcrR family transcriptional regulator [unclassified Streptomyces]|uniref:TetR/AcrR family transcriptional regulator n=1 Tax=unclassified Streptomyces TaxID=2593676 RepID=UPI00225B1690|nr:MULTISPECIES: TetR family transcriptional regulator [unclassified Streptomyces]MCX5330391.1 TetR family transcriptional regulator [Streptomyces sp. NBC_00140]MCX5359788.1 TetR family transcriptional regulator [Streptomyces sp. NBC_00124]